VILTTTLYRNLQYVNVH